MNDHAPSQSSSIVNRQLWVSTGNKTIRVALNLNLFVYLSVVAVVSTDVVARK